MSQGLKHWAHGVKRDLLAVYLAGRDPRVAWYVKLLAVAVAAYALSPLDLIPDFIPVIGYLDDLILVPAGLWLVLQLVPDGILADLRRQAEAIEHRPKSYTAAIVIVAIWIGLLLWLAATTLGRAAAWTQHLST